MSKLNDKKFLNLRSAKSDPALTKAEKKLLKATMNPNVAYEELFDLIAQAGGPNMTQPTEVGEAPMAEDSDVTDISDQWPEQDIIKQTQDLKNQGMGYGPMLQQLIQMGVLGTDRPMAQDIEYLDQVMKRAFTEESDLEVEGERDTLSSEEIEGTGKIGQRHKLSPQEMKKLMRDHGNADSYRDMHRQRAPIPEAISRQEMSDHRRQMQTFTPPSKIGPGIKFNEFDGDPADQLEVTAQAAPEQNGPGAPAPGMPPGAPPDGPPMPGGDMSMDTEPMEMGEEDDRTLSEILEDVGSDVSQLQERIENGETMDMGQNLEPMPEDSGATPAPAPKLAVDEAAKDYYKGYFGDYGTDLTRDRVAEVVEIIERVADAHGDALGAEHITALADFMTADLGILHNKYTRLATIDDKFASVIDTILVNHIMKLGLARSQDLSPEARPALVVAALNSNKFVASKAAEYVKTAEGKMKTPKPKGQSDDAVKLDELKDRADADDSADRTRHNHLHMEVEESSMSGAYCSMTISWDSDDSAADRSAEGMEQAVRSFVKGLESTKEFVDYGFLGQINVDDLDIEGGIAEVSFRTQKPGKSLTMVQTTKQ